MRVVDASVLVSRFVEGDVHYRRTQAWMRRAVAEQISFVIPVLGLIEVGGAIARRTGNSHFGQNAVKAIKRIAGVRILPIDSQLGTQAIDIATRLHLRGADAVYVASAYHLGVPLITWDDEQRTRSAELIQTRTPEHDL